MTGPELTREGERYASRARDLDYLPENPPEPGEALAHLHFPASEGRVVPVPGADGMMRFVRA